MTNVLVDDSYLSDIADTIRAKLGVTDTYLPSEMADAIDDIGGGVTPTGTINITANGTYDVTDYASADVAIPGASGSFTPDSNSKTATISIPFEPSGVFCYSDYDGFPTDNSWKMFSFACIDLTNGGYRVTRYGPSNYNVAARAGNSFSYADGTFTATMDYNFVSGITYKWRAW